MGDEIIHPGGLQGRRLSGGSAGPALQGEGPFADPDQADGGGGADSPPTAAPGALGLRPSSGVTGDLPQF